MEKEKLLQYITCPITKLIFCDPVVAEDGYVYERMAISNHLNKENTSPVTGHRIGTNLMENRRIKELAEDFLQANEEYRNEQFLFKKPFYLFKKDFLMSLKNKEFNNLQEYTSIMLNIDVNRNKETLFEAVCKICPDDVILYIIDNSIDYDVYDSRNLKPFHLACKYGSQTIIKHLMAKDVDVRSTDICGETALGYLLMYRNEPALVKELLEHGISVNSQNQNGFSPSHYVIKNGNIDTFKLFMDYGLKLDSISPLLGNMNLIHFAFRESPSVDLIKYIIELDQHLDVDIQPNNPSEQLIYQNKHLSKQEKQELVYLYLNKLVKRAVVIKDFMDTIPNVVSITENKEKSE